MNCVSCAHENEAFFKFCLRCGAPLPGRDLGETNVGLDDPQSPGRTRPHGGRGRATAPFPELESLAEVVIASKKEVDGAHVRLISLEVDRKDEVAYSLAQGDNPIGRGGNGIAFPSDAFLASRHATLKVDGMAVTLVPEDTKNGVFKKVVNTHVLGDGEFFRVGQELLQFSQCATKDGAQVQKLGAEHPSGLWGRLALITRGRHVQAAWELTEGKIEIGRDCGHIAFPEDGYVSARHAVLTPSDEGAVLRDVGSRNGTFVRVEQELSLQNGDELLMGEQLLRVECTQP